MHVQSDDSWLFDHILDGREKLLRCQKERIVALREDGISYRELGRMFSVSYGAIFWVCNLGAYEKKVQQNIRRQQKKDPDLEMFKENVARSRARKKQLIQTLNIPDNEKPETSVRPSSS